MIAYFLSKLITMFYGMLYPAYCSYKAVKTKDVKEYVHWMMYWVVFSIFSVFEIFFDTFIGCWFPFYYELKILFMVWMLSPTTRGGSILYRRIVHPFLTRHEPEIDEYLTEFKLRTSNLIVQWSSRAFSYATEFVLNAAFRSGAGDFRFMNKVTRSYSYENFDQPDMNRNNYLQDLPPSPGQLSDNNFPYYDASPTTGQPVVRRNIYASNMRFGSVDENLGRMDEVQQYMMAEDEDTVDSQQQQPPHKLRSSTRKKKEAGPYGTLPRSTRTARKTANK